MNTKSELEKAFAKHKKNLNEKKKEQETAESFTGEFQKMIAERARRLEKVRKEIAYSIPNHSRITIHAAMISIINILIKGYIGGVVRGRV